MADFPTRTDLFRVARDRILSLNANLGADVVQRDGTDANIMVAAGTAMADEVVGQLVTVCRGHFLDSAKGPQLDRLVFDRYGLIRNPAAPSLGTEAFTTTAPAPTSFTIPNGTSLTTTSGIGFITVADVTFPAGNTGPIFAPIRSTVAGFNQQAKSGTITNIVSTILGAPSDLVATNLVATAGAADAEGDPSLRDRARRMWTTQQRGTLAALENGALGVAGVVRATAVEVLDSTGKPGHWVQLLISDRFTDALVTINQTSATYDTQSQALARTVFNALSNIRCGGNYVQVIVAQVSLLAVRLDLTFSAGVDTVAVSNTARAVVVNYVNGLAPGAPFVPADALAVLRTVAGLVITGTEIAVPVGSVVPRQMQVLRTTFDLTTATNQGLPLTINSNPDTILGN